MKTDLTKILTVTGQGGLYLFIASAKNGVIAESLADKKRSIFGSNSRISTLEDISIYVEDGETKLKEVFGNMKEALGDEPAPSKNSSPEVLKAFFAKVLPGYDEDRFYVSHMKKVVDWYNILKEHASLEFTDPDAETEETDADA